MQHQMLFGQVEVEIQIRIVKRQLSPVTMQPIEFLTNLAAPRAQMVRQAGRELPMFQHGIRRPHDPVALGGQA